MQPPQPPQNDIAVLEYQIKMLEKQMQEMRIELRQCVQSSVNDVQLLGLQSTVGRIESDVKDARGQVSDLAKQLSKQEKDQDQLQINALRWFGGLVITVLMALLIAYLTHRIG
ncbi:MAG TPA: hypothetical protein VHV10_02860 [Ktedonobacteraceae bacterium]|jgi:chromosome segregation ATPase|nr:hypothetical protein [Ktedonobacteraceae bacterium]